MNKALTPLLCLAVLATSSARADVVDTASLLDDMSRLDLLARWPQPAYRTVQYSSYDRRSTTPDAPHWYSNSDGFGREPIPNFAAVLREPDAAGVGLYLVADVDGPGAIVRTWSAAMGGVLRVWLDGAEAPIWEGSAFEFFARRSEHFFERAGLEIECDDAFVQQDADYFPIPFATHLRVTWEGRLRELHFYHLQVRFYDAGTAVRTFDAKRDVNAAGAERIRAVAEQLTQPANRLEGEAVDIADAVEVGPGGSWSWSREREGPGAISQIVLRVDADDIERALRGSLLTIAFDGAGQPQVEAPLGDFFATGPGVNPMSSLPFSVAPDGTMTSRFVMPFKRGVTISLRNWTPFALRVTGAVTVSPWKWDERSLYFRAKWRVDHDLIAGGAAGVFDIPYVVARGRGSLVVLLGFTVDARLLLTGVDLIEQLGPERGVVRLARQIE